MKTMQIHCKFDSMAKVGVLRPHPKNRNKHPDDQIERLAKILAYQGIRAPIVVSEASGFIVKGHGTLLAIKANGWTEAPIVIQHFDTPEVEYSFVQSDNAIAAWAELDLGGINTDIGDLGPDFDLDLLGIKDFVLEPAELIPQTDDDAVPDYAEPNAKPGDIWTLGRHRLMCGDSTRIDSVAALMNGELADLWLTDPPYGVAYQSNGAEHKHRKIANDSMPIDEMKTFWTDCAASAYSATTDKSAYYWFACQGGDQMMMMMAIGDGGWQVKHELMWLKDRLVLGRCDYHYKHEPILYGWKRGGTHEWFGDRKQTSVLECKKPTSSDIHPTMKPIELLEPLINNSTKPGQKVLDLFGGSGSTMIACEKTNRACFTMELDPTYCDRIVARWEQYTGGKAVLQVQPV